jgi:hypothetical protein
MPMFVRAGAGAFDGQIWITHYSLVDARGFPVARRLTVCQCSFEAEAEPRSTAAHASSGNPRHN